MIGVAAVAFGLGLGWASGGSLRGLASVRLRFEIAALLLFVLQAIARGRIFGSSATPAGFFVWVVACVGLMLVLLPSWREPGIWVVVAALGLNLAVVLVNLGMPVALPSGVDASAASATALRSAGFYQLAGPGTIGAMVGDSMPMHLMGARFILSPGDVLLSVGVAVFVVGAMRLCDSRVPGDRP